MPVATFAAAVAMWSTLRAGFLAHPGWLAVQKADLILGPVLVGAYWLHVRPRSRFGWLLVAYGLLCFGYVAQSSTRPWLFGTGLVWESVIYLGNVVLILAFPTGRLEGLAARLVLAGAACAAALNVWLIVMLPDTGAGGAISGCRRACPRNGLGFAPNVSRALTLLKPSLIVVMAVSVATAALLGWRIATGTPPQRRALATGTSVALVFLTLQVVYLSLRVWSVDAPDLQEGLQWGFTAARSAVWYGFLAALIVAQLFAGRTLRRLVRGSLERPSRVQLQAMLREPLGDPDLELHFWNEEAGAWDGPLQPRESHAVTVVEREGRPAVALVHDRQLEDDPELLQAAGAVALLAAENADLDAAWNEAVNDVRRSRQRMSRAVDDERRRVANDLHDSVQQRLTAIRIRLATTARLSGDEVTRERLDDLGESVSEVIEEVREVAHGLSPHLLVERGLVLALEHALGGMTIEHGDLARYPAEIESAIFYCCLEAVQNARKHGRPDTTVSIAIREGEGELSFVVADDGPGFDASATHEGIGLQSLHDRMVAVGGRLHVTTQPGVGTSIAGFVRVGEPSAPAAGAG